MANTLRQKGIIINESWAALTNWTSSGGLTVSGGRLQFPATSVLTFGNKVKQDAYGGTKLNKHRIVLYDFTIPTISGTTYGISLGLDGSAPLYVRFCTDTTKQGLIEIYVGTNGTVLGATSINPLTITAGDSTNVSYRRIRNTIIAVWKNNTTGKTSQLRYEMSASNGNAKPPNFGQFVVVNHGANSSAGQYIAESNEVVGADFCIIADSIAGSSVDNTNQSWPTLLEEVVENKICLFYGNSDRIEDNNWAEVVAHEPRFIYLSCFSNNANIVVDTTATLLTKIASAISSLTGYTYGTNLFLSNIMPRTDIDVSSYSTAIEGAYANTVDLWTSFKALSGTGLEPTKTFDTIHLNPEAHFDYANIILNYFTEQVPLFRLKGYPRTYNRPVYYQGNNVQLGGLKPSEPLYPLEIRTDGTKSYIKFNANSPAGAGSFLGNPAGSAAALDLLAGISYDGGTYVARHTNVCGIQMSSNGTISIFSRTATIGNATSTTSTAALKWDVDINGNFRIGVGAALSTSATNGFIYIPSCAGKPTGTPTTKTGSVPLCMDTTNGILYAYVGGWIPWHRLKGYTVGTLPTGVAGDRAYVTDATAPTYNGTLTGGGAVVVPVFYNGSAWVSA